MIIILEGCNGVGKSEYARRLSDELKVPICRPFRNDNTDLHWDLQDTELQEWLKDAKVPVNTHVDDLYVVDFLNNFGVGAILDRSMPSAIAYGRVLNLLDGYYQNKLVCQSLYEFWENRMPKGRSLMVWLNCSYEHAKSRNDGRAFPMKGTWTKLENEFRRLFQVCNLPNKKQINTSTVKVDDGVKSILKVCDDFRRVSEV